MNEAYRVAWDRLKSELNDVDNGEPVHALEAVEEIIEELEGMRDALRDDVARR